MPWQPGRANACWGSCKVSASYQTVITSRLELKWRDRSDVGRALSFQAGIIQVFVGRKRNFSNPGRGGGAGSER